MRRELSNGILYIGAWKSKEAAYFVRKDKVRWRHMLKHQCLLRGQVRSFSNETLQLMRTCDMDRTFVGLHQIVVTLFGGSRTEIKQKCKEAEDQLRFIF